MRSKYLKKYIAFFIALAFFVGSIVPATAEAVLSNEVHYVALGDSLAAGQSPYQEIDTGYTDLIASYFEEQQLLGSYTNQFAVPGYTSQNVLDDLLNNREVAGTKIQDAIRNATLITITVGANDILREANVNFETGTITVDQKKVVQTLAKQKENLSRLFQTIKRLNPDAAVYISGYYQAFPYLAKEQLAELDSIFQALNGTIQLTATENNVHFVPLEGIFDYDVTTYLPNQTDIHPSIEGYEQIANAFITSFQTKPMITFEDVPESYWAYSDISLLVNQQILNGISDTHFGIHMPITRAETAEALLKLIPFDQSIPEDPGFADVSESDDAYYAIAKLTQAGVFNQAERFYPDAPLTRAQMAKVLTVTFNLQEDDEASATFNDVSASHWAHPYVDALVSSNITTGYPDHTFRPDTETTRSQFAAFLVRSYYHLGQQR
ncbi:S-layer homology domain-containing protein [Halalkalibacter nanhaiisediminis]|uniref:Lysophospholipase L1-like esterase n=1 Tax=Halalkalibacter nanhaiisediminis TaxID=688079 RepID=A0A562QUC3_9BACI|nr:S-layer homology domain-containing protein [Halalkalibacter nanhaiisediminis]TWI59840.1 lysophospholipase L1-like esterase [Halalkalibacter nanhaiisediminis]